jgi:nucleotide-binding universal stress UspA family protein
MYQNILLAYDGSPDGREALAQVKNLAAMSGATVRLLAIIDPSENMLVVEGMSFVPDNQQFVTHLTQAWDAYRALDALSLGLAPVIVERLMDVLATIRDDGVTVLLVEQDVNLALSIADRGYVMETGRIVHSGLARRLIDDPEVRRAYLAFWASLMEEPLWVASVRCHPVAGGRWNCSLAYQIAKKEGWNVSSIQTANRILND